MSKVSTKFTNKPKMPKVKISEKNMLELQNVRILQKNLVYVIGLSSKIANLDVNLINKCRFYQKKNTSVNMAKY